MSIELPQIIARRRQVYTLDEVPDDLAALVRTSSAPADAAAFDDEVAA